jgi:hypothetical protein
VQLFDGVGEIGCGRRRQIGCRHAFTLLRGYDRKRPRKSSGATFLKVIIGCGLCHRFVATT